MSVTGTGDTHNDPTRNRTPNTLIREHKFIPAIRTIEVPIHGVRQSYPLFSADTKIDICKLGIILLFIPGFVRDLTEHLKVRTAREESSRHLKRSGHASLMNRSH